MFCDVVMELYEVVKSRKKELPEGSYTSSLFKQGEDRILQKLGEEAIETIIALKSQGKERAVSEVADLMYHLLVALVDKDISLEDVGRELEKRRK